STSEGVIPTGAAPGPRSRKVSNHSVRPRTLTRKVAHPNHSIDVDPMDPPSPCPAPESYSGPTLRAVRQLRPPRKAGAQAGKVEHCGGEDRRQGPAFGARSRGRVRVDPLEGRGPHSLRPPSPRAVRVPRRDR